MMRLYLFLAVMTLVSVIGKAADRPASIRENNATVTSVAANHVAQEEEKLRLMFQVFTYSSDLNNAYKVGKRALKLFPDSLYWHQKMAEVSQWIDKPNEAIRHYQFIYQRTHDRKLRKKILDYSLAAYQYETAAPILKEIALSDPNEKNLANVVDIYNKIGSPEKAAEMLEHLALKKEINATLAAKALKLYTEIGEETSAKALVEKLEKVKWYDMYTAKIIGDYYLAKKDPESAYRIMQKVKPETLKGHAQTYYRWMSDMGWYLQKFKAAASASKALYETGEAQPQDYERILFYFRDKNTQLVGRVSYDAYHKFGKKYLYINYLDTLMRQKLYGRLIDEVQKAFHEDIGSVLKSEVYVWLMLGQAYAEEKAYEKSIAAYKEALRLDPSSAEIEAAILWNYIDHKQTEALRIMIGDLEERGKIVPKLALPLAVGNFTLQRADRAMIYVKRLMRQNPENIDLKFMYAYLMQAREETGGFMMTMEEIYETLSARRKKRPSLMKDATFVEQYLKSGMYFMPVDRFEDELHRAKSVLKAQTYTEIMIFQTLRHRAQERATYLVGRLKEIAPWMQLNIALFEDARADQQAILYRYYTILPIRDRVTAAVRTGNIALAQTLAFKGLEENRRDYLLYQQMRDLDEKYADLFHTRGGIQRRTELDRKYLELSGRYYLKRGWRLFARAESTGNRIRESEVLKTVPKTETLFLMGLQKRFMRGTYSFAAGVRSAMKNYGFFQAKVHYDIISRIFIEAEGGTGLVADETTYLLLGGKKDELKLRTSFQYLPSTSISLILSGQHFESQDNYYLGRGYRATVEWYHQIRSGYPDLAWSLFAEYGNYHEKKGARGVVEKLLNFPQTLVLPETFYSLGTTFYYGMANKQYYTRVWRPYASFSPYYNGLNHQVNFSFDAGVGGLVHDRDHLNFGMAYDQSVNGTMESNFRIYFHYKHFFE